ncbi:glycine--tRNA ligase, mitochondrial 1-like [Humulus lupulus]|uniref:glycine--tRNA ligase, mitochondrial 1-like n=1 Tax=Humulus lupulus TaxID=3486 RepID=UPI002B4183EF|nr:glycine--tRNA ligase, mitochondrial 1-like [Humulus lupulus]
MAELNIAEGLNEGLRMCGGLNREVFSLSLHAYLPCDGKSNFRSSFMFIVSLQIIGGYLSIFGFDRLCRLRAARIADYSIGKFRFMKFSSLLHFIHIFLTHQWFLSLYDSELAEESSILNEHMVVLLPGAVYALSAGYKMEELEQHSMHELFECSIDVLANIDQVSSVKVLGFCIKVMHDKNHDKVLQHFILEENMLEVDCPCVTPEVVLKASGHVDKFTDLMVKDEKTGTCYRADHLLKDFCSEKLQKDLSITTKEAVELKRILGVLDDLSTEELGAKLKEYGITAPDTKNPLSDPYPFNLMFQTSIGPSGLSPGFMRPETTQGIFVNFKDLYYYNGNKLPFAAAQIGQAFRNEISPRQGLFRVRKFTRTEIEHFVDPEDKSHPNFAEVAKLEFLMFPREEQMSGESAKKICLGDAVARGIVNNETLGYFIGRVYLFLTRLGINEERLRFRQHLANEMAHYACDCWDAEIECSYGWIESVGIADRSAFDLHAHTVSIFSSSL